MKKQKKIAYGYSKFFVAAILILGTYTLLRWLLSIRFHIIDLKESVWEFGIPFTLFWIPIFLFLRPYFFAYRFQSKTYKDASFGLSIFSSLAIIIPSIIFQTYFSNITGKYVEVNFANDILQNETARFYKIDNARIFKKFGAIYNHVYHTSGSRGSAGYRNLDVFFACPIQSDSTFIRKDDHVIWYSLKYGIEVSEGKSDDFKTKVFDSFYRTCLNKINFEDTSNVKFFENLPTSDDRNYFLRAISNVEYFTTPHYLYILKPERISFKEINKGKLLWVFISFLIGSTFLIIVFASAKTFNTDETSNGLKNYKNELNNWLSFLIPRQGHWISSSLIVLCTICFLLLSCFSTGNIFQFHLIQLLKFGINYKPETTQYEYWRLITNVFVHDNVLQLCFNVVALVLIAKYIEPVVGSIQMLWIFLLCSLAGSVTSIVWYDAYASFGMSTFIFGLTGFLIVRAFFNNTTFDVPTIVRVSIFIVYIIIALMEGLNGETDNAAQIGAFVFGGFISLTFHSFKPNNSQN